jgi:hypothetical protein
LAFGLQLVIKKKEFGMKKSQLIALTALAATVASAGVTIYLRRKKKQEKRLIAVSNAGYEMAYDIHFPVKYKSAK